jgi:GT2 family glycosyltransferase
MQDKNTVSSAPQRGGAGRPIGARLDAPIKVIDIDMSRPIAGAENLSSYTAVRALVRLQGEPLGWVELPIAGGGYTAEALRSALLRGYGPAIERCLKNAGLADVPASAWLDALGNLPVAVYHGPFPSVSVAICTHERPRSLELCLQSICGLDYPDLEVIVVDNAPRSDATEQLVRSRYPQVRYAREPRPGLSWARNRAILEAQGAIVAFADDDLVADAGWAAAIVRVFAAYPEVMAVTGLVVPYELETEAQWLFERHGGFGRGFDRAWFRAERHQDMRRPTHHSSGRCGTGANMAYRRDLFDRIGFFAPELGAGTPTTGGEDIEMFFRLLQEGYTLLYEPRAIMRHRHRRTYAELRAQIAGNGVGLSAYFLHSGAAYPGERASFFRLGMRWLWRWHIKRLIKSLLRRLDLPIDLIFAELSGYVRGPERYYASRRLAARVERAFGPLISSSLPAPAQLPGHRGSREPV